MPWPGSWQTRPVGSSSPPRHTPELWPGHGVKPTSLYQFIEPGQVLEGREVYAPMAAEDYDWFLDDPSDYMIRAYFPKICGALEPLSKLPPIHGVICYYQGIYEALSVIGTPEVQHRTRSCQRAVVGIRCRGYARSLTL